MTEPVFFPADGTSRKCAMPNFDYLYGKYPLQRHYRVQYLYDEYVQACVRAGERPYAFKSFIARKIQWRRGRVNQTLPPWHPAERLCCYWAQPPDNLKYGEQGKRRYLFVATLPYSEYTFMRAHDGAGPLAWIRCCMEAYDHLGGIPYVTECPFAAQLERKRNSKTVPLTLQAFAVHYRTVLYHSAPKTSKTASKRVKPLTKKCSSAATRYVRKELADAPPMSTAKLNDRLAALMEEFNSALGERNVPRRTLFKAHEAPQLLSLPKEPYDMSLWTERQVGADYHFKYKAVSYSVPYQYAFEIVRLRVRAEEIEVYSSGILIASHPIPKQIKGKPQLTDPAHRPPSHRGFAKRLDLRFMRFAREVGPATGAVMKEVLSTCKKEEKGYRRCKDLLDLQNMPAGVPLEEACMKVLECDLEMTVESVRRVMQDGTW